MSPCNTKQFHSYLDSDDNICHFPESNNYCIYATFAAPAGKKTKKGMHTTAWEDTPAENIFYTPLQIKLDSDLEAFWLENLVVTKLEQLTDDFDFHFKNRSIL